MFTHTRRALARGMSLAIVLLPAFALLATGAKRW